MGSPMKGHVIDYVIIIKKWISLGKNVIEKSMGYGAVTGPEAKDYL